LRYAADKRKLCGLFAMTVRAQPGRQGASAVPAKKKRRKEEKRREEKKEVEEEKKLKLNQGDS
jgi:ribosomal protein L12E/L44/L45/RPP1/RPP2